VKHDSATSTREELVDRLAPFGQEHLLRFWEELSEAGRRKLAGQIEAVDLSQIQQLYRQGAG